MPRIVQLLRDAGLGNVGILVGGIIPEADAAQLRQSGVARVFGPGTPLDDIVSFVRQPREATNAG